MPINFRGYGGGYSNRNSLPRFNAAMPGYGGPLQTVNRLQNLESNQLAIEEAPKENKRREERHQWSTEDRDISKEFKALQAASQSKNPQDAELVYENMRPDKYRSGRTGKKMTFKKEGGNLTIDGGGGGYRIEGPEVAVQGLLEEIEKYPGILSDPKQVEAMLKLAAEHGVSLTKNDVGTSAEWKPGSKQDAIDLARAKKSKAGWKPGSKQDAIDLARAKKSKAGTDPKKTVAQYRKEVARLATVRERIRKGDQFDQILKMMSSKVRKKMGIGAKDTKDEAIAKIDDYEKWLRTQIRELEGGGSDAGGTSENPLGLQFGE